MRAGAIARRTFLIGSAALAGGVAFGVYVLRRPHPNPLADDLAADEATFNPWVKIGPGGITLVAPHTDVGQGIRSLQAALIAEELDVEFGQFDVVPGPPAAAYWNTAGGDDLLPYPPGDRGFVAETMRGAVAAVGKLLAMQVTGGSMSVPDSFVKLREAGAVARETLKLAASRRSGHPVAALTTEGGRVVLPDGTRIPYTALAVEAADLRPVTKVALRDPASWRLLGRGMERLDIVAKSTGTLAYGIDLRHEDMVHAAVRLSPRRGRLLTYDASSAMAMEGVQRVLEVTDGLAVIADNTWTAFQGAQALTVEWGPAPFPADQDAHWQRLAEAFADAQLDREWRHDGDVPRALAAAEGLALEYRAPYLAHAPLEPLGALTLVTDERAEMWVAHQFPGFAQAMVADITGHHIDRVGLHNQFAGGSFGHRLEFENVRCGAEIARQLPGTPVKLTFRREEDFAREYVRHIGLCRVTGQVRDGQVETLDIATASPAVLNEQMARIGLPAGMPDGQLRAGLWNAPYAIPNMRVRAYAAEGLAPVSSWRSVGASINGFFLEAALDELIAAAGADPLEERLRLCREPSAQRVLEAVGEMCRWGEDPGPGRGRGIALVVSFGVPVAEVVEVTRTDAGIRIDRVWVAAEVGRVLDPVNFENQVQGGVVWGLGHAMNCEITWRDGMAEQRNYDAFSAMRLHQCPEIIVRGLEHGAVRGIGEPPVPPAAPALANAIFAATGMRLREMPFARFVDFV